MMKCNENITTVRSNDWNISDSDYQTVTIINFTLTNFIEHTIEILFFCST